MMNIFSYIYEKMLSWSAHHRAPYYLAGVSFAESSFFPVPPDVMLMSMGLAKPKRSWHFAAIATLFSVLGGLFGYALGYFGMAFIKPYLMASSYAPYVTKITHWFDHQGIAMVVLAGFSPFPYKIFTITSGMMQLALFPFIMGSVIGRGLRFFIVSGILYFLGEIIEPHLRRCVDRIVWFLVVIFIIAFLLVSCSERDDLAPVEEHRWYASNAHPSRYVVVSGDTLYSIAFRYDLDYRKMAKFNRLQSPYTLRVGQQLQLRDGQFDTQSSPPPTRTQHRFIQTHKANPALRMSRQAPERVPLIAKGWLWPAKGQIIAHFSPERGIKGINIAGQKGDVILSSSDGIVAYAGNGLAGYGNLIIIKHNNQYLTAYGNNLQNKVHEGQSVQKGQVIASMGKLDRRYWGVHFEMRRMGRPVNPLSYLKR
jgi:lipoprotein NlpD